MGFLDTVKAWLSQEASAAADAKQDLERRWSADLASKERELNASPAEKMEMLQGKIAANDSAFDDIRSSVEGRDALAHAVSDVEDISTTAASADVLNEPRESDSEPVDSEPVDIDDADIEDAVIVDLDEQEPDA